MKKQVTYNPDETVFDYWRSLNPDPLFEDYAELVQNHPLLSSLNMLTDSSILIFDHVNIRYAYVSDSQEKISGHKPSLFLEQNWEFSKTLIPASYIDFALTLSHRLSFDYLYSIPVELRKKVLFTKDYLYTTKDRGIVRFLQKGMVLKLDDHGNIQLTLHIATEISHLKKKGSANLIITNPEGDNKIYVFDELSQVLTEHGSLTGRQKDILLLLEKKKDSQEIAALLNVSAHTVNTHRRKLLNKLNCVNTTALVIYCRMCGLL